MNGKGKEWGEGKAWKFKIEGMEEKEGGLKVEEREKRSIEWNRKKGWEMKIDVKERGGRRKVRIWWQRDEKRKGEGRRKGKEKRGIKKKRREGRRIERKRVEEIHGEEKKNEEDWREKGRIEGEEKRGGLNCLCTERCRLSSQALPLHSLIHIQGENIKSHTVYSQVQKFVHPSFKIITPTTCHVGFTRHSLLY